MQYQCVHSIETASCREQSITEIPPVSFSRGASTLSRKLCFRVTSTWGRGSTFLGCWFVLLEGRAQLLGVNSLAPALKQPHLLKSWYQKIATGLKWVKMRHHLSVFSAVLEDFIFLLSPLFSEWGVDEGEVHNVLYGDGTVSTEEIYACEYNIFLLVVNWAVLINCSLTRGVESFISVNQFQHPRTWYVISENLYFSFKDINIIVSLFYFWLLLNLLWKVL